MKLVVSLAVEESFRDSYYYLQPIHLFLAILRQGDNTALTILKNLGVDLAALEKEVRSRFLGTETSE
jgi:ATP-dependent Clp protease ATP-binding subunit ClpA